MTCVREDGKARYETSVTTQGALDRASVGGQNADFFVVTADDDFASVKHRQRPYQSVVLRKDIQTLSQKMRMIDE